MTDHEREMHERLIAATQQMAADAEHAIQRTRDTIEHTKDLLRVIETPRMRHPTALSSD